MTDGRHLRVVTLCGSIKPLFSGTEDYNDALAAALRERGVEVVPVDLGSWGIGSVGRMLGAVAAHQPDVIALQYPTDAFGHQLGPQGFALLQRIAPLVLTLHEFTASHVLRRVAILPLVLRAAAVITTADKEADALRRWFPWLRRRLEVIPVGAAVPPRAWRPDPRREVVTFGQIRPQKGLELFLQCRDRLVQQDPNLRFTILGSRVPQFSAYYDSIAAQAAERGIALVTGLDADAVSDRLAAASLALLPYPDGASMRRTSMLAAAVCGTPIVTLTGSDTPPPLADLLGRQETFEHMAALAARCLADPLALQDAHARSVRLAASVGWEAIASRYLGVLRRVTGRAAATGLAPSLAPAAAGAPDDAGGLEA